MIDKKNGSRSQNLACFPLLTVFVLTINISILYTSYVIQMLRPDCGIFLNQEKDI